MGLLDSLVQLAKIYKNKELNPKDKTFWVLKSRKNWENTLVEIWDENGTCVYKTVLSNEKGYLEELAEKLVNYEMLPTNPKGGSLGIKGGGKEVYNGTFQELAKKINNLNLREILKKRIYNDIGEEIKNNNKIKRVLILLKIQNRNKPKHDESKRVKCMICGEEIVTLDTKEISKALPWLVSINKNITFICNHSRQKYYQNLSICENCLNALINSQIEGYLDLKTNYFTFLNYRFKVFPEVITEKDENKNVQNVWDMFKPESERSFDDVINEIINRMQPDNILFREGSIFINVLIYKQENNKVDVVEQLEDIRLIDVLRIYHIFNEWKKSDGKKLKNIKLISNSSLLGTLLIKEGKTILNQDLVLDLLAKLLRSERIDKMTQMRIMSIFNILSRRYLYSKEIEKIEGLINLITFFDFYNNENEKGKIK